MVFFVALPFFTVPHFLNYISVGGWLGGPVAVRVRGTANSLCNAAAAEPRPLKELTYPCHYYWLRGFFFFFVSSETNLKRSGFAS
jgi:hypothetical protein